MSIFAGFGLAFVANTFMKEIIRNKVKPFIYLMSGFMMVFTYGLNSMLWTGLDELMFI